MNGLTAKGSFLRKWFFEGNLCEQCKGFDGCPKFNCKGVQRAFGFTDAKWNSLAEEFVFQDKNTNGLYVDDLHRLFKKI